MSEWISVKERLPDLRGLRTIYEIDEKGNCHSITGPRTYLAWTHLGLELWVGGMEVFHDKNGDHYLTPEHYRKSLSPDITKRDFQNIIKYHSVQYWMEVPLPPGWVEGEPPVARKEEDHDNI